MPQGDDIASFVAVLGVAMILLVLIVVVLGTLLVARKMKGRRRYVSLDEQPIIN